MIFLFMILILYSFIYMVLMLSALQKETRGRITGEKVRILEEI